jgi:uncharacterized protein (DUF1778 family)
VAYPALRTERTEARLLPEQKRRIERAASHKGVSVSDFMVQAADEAAVRTIQQHESWVLEEADRDAFVRALLHPWEPNEALRLAAEDHKRRVRRS